MIEKLIDSNIKTPLLEEMHKTNEALIRNVKAVGGSTISLINWRNDLSAAISIRKAMNV